MTDDTQQRPDPGEERPDRGEERPDGAQTTLRRVYLHALAFLGLMLSASGAAGLLRLALEGFAGPELARDTAGALALGLSLLIVGLPVWLLAWRGAQRGVAASADDTRALPRRLHLAAVRATALTIAVVHAFGLGAWLVGVDAYDAAALARVLVWGLVWAYHERVAAEVPVGSPDTGRLDRLYLYAVSTVGLVLLAGGAGTVLARSLERVYDRLFRPEAVLLEGGAELRTAALAVVIGGAVWWWHWGVRARRDRDATGWHVYLFLVGVLGGAAAAITGASRLVYHVLLWLMFVVDEALTEHFSALPAALATLVVGAAAWGYHRAVVREQAPSGTWTGPERVYQHLLVAVGVVTTAAGVATVLTFGMEFLLPADTLVETTRLGRRALAAGLTLLLVGVPLWATSWTRLERVARGSPRERRSTPRRTLIFGAFGLATLVSVGALGALLYTTFEALFADRWTIDVLADQRWSVALLLTAGAISAHYGLVLREDRRTAPAEAPVAPPVALRRLTVLAARPHVLARQLADDLGVAVEVWVRLDVATERRAVEEEGVVVDLDALVAHLRGLTAEDALVIVFSPELDTTAPAWEVIPLERGGGR